MTTHLHFENRIHDLEERLRNEQIKNQKLILENARLSTEYRKFAILVEFGKKIALETHMDRLLALIMQQTRQILLADRCTLFLVDSEKQQLWSKLAHGLSASYEIRIPISQGIAGSVAVTSKLINIPDAYKDNRFNPAIDARTGYKTRSILCAPMRNSDGETTGVFQVLNKQAGPFNHEDEELLLILASQAAIAVQNTLLLDAQKKTFDSFVKTLAATIDARDPITSGHSYRVMRYCLAIGAEFKLDEPNLELLRYAALLHDLGKIGIRESILSKPGRLTPEEYVHIQQHVVYSEQILSRIYFSRQFRQLPLIAGGHHEKFNGTGYPRKLKGESIHFLSRVMAVADVFDAITFKRHYRDPMPIEEALDILVRDSGSHFDPECVGHFLQVPLDEIVRIGEPEDSQKLQATDMELFAAYTTGDFYQIIKNRIPSQAEAELVEKFNFYYSQHASSEFQTLF